MDRQEKEELLRKAFESSMKTNNLGYALLQALDAGDMEKVAVLREHLEKHIQEQEKSSSFTVVMSQYDDNIFYVRRGDGSNSNQDEATVVVFGKSGSAVPSRDALDFVENSLGARGYEDIMHELAKKGSH
jgi:hypothetical protein